MIRLSQGKRFSLAMILGAHWWTFIEQYGKWIRPVVFENVRKVLWCRSAALGFHVYSGLSCSYTRLVVHSCKSRFCPVCGKHRTDQWADELLNDLLAVPYHHVVLAVPKLMTYLFSLNRKVLLDIVCHAARESILDWGRKVKGMRMGLIMVVHTFGSQLNLHLHVHLIVTGGGLSLDGRRWIATDPRYLMNHGGSIRYRGRYTKRAVLAEYRIIHYDGKKVGFRYKDYAAGGKSAFKFLSVHAFIGRLIRHCGLFANRWKGRYLHQARKALRQCHPKDLNPKPWSQRQKEMTGRDPLWCPYCEVPLVFQGVLFGFHTELAAIDTFVERFERLPPHLCVSLQPG